MLMMMKMMLVMGMVMHEHVHHRCVDVDARRGLQDTRCSQM